MSYNQWLSFLGLVLLCWLIYRLFQRFMPRCRCVQREVLFRSGQLRGFGLWWLKLRGISTVVNLRALHSDGLAEEEAFAEAHEIDFVNLPVGTTAEELTEAAQHFMDIMNDPSNWPVLVHCSSGKERAGFLSAIYLIEKADWDNEAALAETYRLGLVPGHLPLVEQEILYWRRSQPPKLRLSTHVLSQVQWQE